MNKARRRDVQDLITDITVARSTIEEAVAAISSVSIEDLESAAEAIRDEEQEYYDNMPENMQGSERGETAQENVNALEAAIAALEEAREMLEKLDDVLSKLEDAEGELDNAQN